MMEHTILSPNRVVRELPTFDQLEKVDYGGNVPSYEEHVPEWNDPILDSPPASFNHDQFIGWLHLPALRHLEIWLRDTARLKERLSDLNSLQTLILTRSTIPEDVPYILNRTTSLQKLHLVLAYLYYYGYIFEKSDCIFHALESVSNTVERLWV